MTDRTGQETSATAGELLVGRAFDAPRELVFEAWSKPEHFARWFGPHGSTVPYCAMDFRPGGDLHFCVREATGEEVWGKGIYHEVVAPERIVFKTFFADEEGNRVDRPGFPPETLIEVDFREDGGGTTVSVRVTGLVVDQGERQGLIDSLERLATYLEDPSMKGTR